MPASTGGGLSINLHNVKDEEVEFHNLEDEEEVQSPTSRSPYKNSYVRP